MLAFINMIAEGDIEAALDFSQTNLKQYTEARVMILTRDSHGKEKEMDVVEVTALICYPEP